MKRTFIALKVEPGEKLADAVREMKLVMKDEHVKWVDLNQAHVTLAFIGQTSEDSVRDISEMLSARCQGFGDIDIIVKGMGVFRSLRDPKVIWAGITATGRLGDLYAKITEGLEGLGIITGDHGFKPHLTLGRVRSLKDQNSLRKHIGKFENVIFQEGKVSEVIYYESILQQTGPLYLPLKRVRLK